MRHASKGIAAEAVLLSGLLGVALALGLHTTQPDTLTQLKETPRHERQHATPCICGRNGRQGDMPQRPRSKPSLND